MNPTEAVAARLRALADQMEAIGLELQKLDVEFAFSRGGELRRAADIAREWASELRKE